MYLPKEALDSRRLDSSWSSGKRVDRRNPLLAFISHVAGPIQKVRLSEVGASAIFLNTGRVDVLSSKGSTLRIPS